MTTPRPDMGAAELPGLRQGVRALRVPRGLLVHDALRWRIFSAPADLGPRKLRDFLSANGLDADAPVPAVRPRLQQVFRVAADQLPEPALRVREGARFSCACCGASCRSMRLGPILPADVQRLVRADWSGTDRDPRSFFVDAEGQPVPPEVYQVYTTYTSAEGVQPYLRSVGKRCQFLRDDELCEVHARFGALAKPLMCRMFPYVFRATPTGVAVSLRLGECASAPAASRGLPVVEQREDLRGMLAEHREIPLVPPSVWVRERLIAWEEYERIEQGLLALPPQAAPGAFAAAVVRAFDPAPAAEGLEELLARAGLAGLQARPLEPAAVDLEDRICRSALFGKELFLAPDLSWAAALLAIRALLARIEARDGAPRSLNQAWKSGADRPLRDLCPGLDVRGIASRIAS